MKQLAQAISDLRSCPGTGLSYIGASLVVLALFRAGAYCVSRWGDQFPFQAAAPLAGLFLALFLAVGLSAAQAVFYAAMGAETAKPMWKYKGVRDALARFLLPWLMLNLLIVTLMDVANRFEVSGGQEEAALFRMVVLAAHLASMPVGVCIMFWGRLEWREMGEILAPLGRFLPMTLAPFGLALFQYLFSGFRSEMLGELTPATFVLFLVSDIPLVILDAIVFLLFWRICMLDRITPRDDYNDFDF